MMDRDLQQPLNELDWLAFLANQKGWTNLADRIYEDVAAMQERQEELADELSQLRADRTSDDKNQNAA